MCGVPTTPVIHEAGNTVQRTVPIAQLVRAWCL